MGQARLCDEGAVQLLCINSSYTTFHSLEIWWVHRWRRLRERGLWIFFALVKLVEERGPHYFIITSVKVSPCHLTALHWSIGHLSWWFHRLSFDLVVARVYGLACLWENSFLELASTFVGKLCSCARQHLHHLIVVLESGLWVFLCGEAFSFSLAFHRWIVLWLF